MLTLTRKNMRIDIETRTGAVKFFRRLGFKSIRENFQKRLNNKDLKLQTNNKRQKNEENKHKKYTEKRMQLGILPSVMKKYIFNSTNGSVCDAPRPGSGERAAPWGTEGGSGVRGGAGRGGPVGPGKAFTHNDAHQDTMAIGMGFRWQCQTQHGHPRNIKLNSSPSLPGRKKIREKASAAIPVKNP